MRTRNSEQEDYLIRLIQEIGRAVARLREMLLGATSSGAAVRTEIASNAQRLLGSHAGMLDQLDAVTAARLIGSQSRLALWAQLLDLEAESWARDGDAERAAAVTARATALRAAAATLTE